MTCPHEQLDGAYLLGALSPHERIEYERHLSECAECALAVRELAGLPGLLAQVDPADLEATWAGAPVPDTLLPSLVRQVRRTRRRRTAWTAGVAAAAAAVVAAAAFTFGEGRGSGEPPIDAAPRVSSSVSPTGRAMTTTGQDVMTADLAVTTVAWGTRLDLTCRYAAGDGDDYSGTAPAYSLVIRTRQGQVEQVATWVAPPGRTMHLTAATATPKADITGVEIRNVRGDVMLTQPS